MRFDLRCGNSVSPLLNSQESFGPRVEIRHPLSEIVEKKMWEKYICNYIFLHIFLFPWIIEALYINTLSLKRDHRQITSHVDIVL